MGAIVERLENTEKQLHQISEGLLTNHEPKKLEKAYKRSRFLWALLIIFVSCWLLVFFPEALVDAKNMLQ